MAKLGTPLEIPNNCLENIVYGVGSGGGGGQNLNKTNYPSQGF